MLFTSIGTSRPLRTRMFVAGLLSLGLLVPAAWADEGPIEFVNDYHVYSPTVTQGQSELELRAAQYRDGSPTLDTARGYAVSVAHGFTAWWKPEIYFGTYERAPGGPNTLDAYEFENTFQLTDTGKYWADVGFLASYEYKVPAGEANEFEFGPLFEKQTGHVTQRLNLVFEKEVGTGASRQYGLRTGYSLNYAWRRGFAPGFEAYAHPHEDVYSLGPSVRGELVFGGSEIEYTFGAVFGMNARSPDTALMLRLEYEFF